MEVINDLFSAWYEGSFSLLDEGFTGYAILFLVWVCNFLVGAMLYLFIIKPILYKKQYSQILVDNNVIVLDKKRYTQNTTTYITTGKITTPMITTTTYHYVYLKGNVIDQRIDSSKYYESLSAGQKVVVEYQEVYESLRFSTEDNWEFIGNDVVRINGGL